ncbi:MAG: hypothetical protein ACYDHH_20865 [Solirubrobacteraceae bacterium]
MYQTCFSRNICDIRSWARAEMYVKPAERGISAAPTPHGAPNLSFIAKTSQTAQPHKAEAEAEAEAKTNGEADPVQPKIRRPREP